MMTGRNADPYGDLLEREIVLTRLIDAPRALVFDAWTTPDHFIQWFGPGGFSCVMHEASFAVGGKVRFDMTAPNGHVYGNRIVILDVKAPERLVFEHGQDIDDDPERFRVTLTFDEQSNGKTVLTLRQIHPTAELRRAKMGFGAVEYGIQTLDKLAAFVATRAAR